MGGLLKKLKKNVVISAILCIAYCVYCHRFGTDPGRIGPSGGELLGQRWKYVYPDQYDCGNHICSSWNMDCS